MTPRTTPRLAFHASDAVRAALATIGRTEDLRFSPDGRLLAIAGFTKNRCLILRIQLKATPDGPCVTANDFMELASEGITKVHGVDFLDDRTLALANRDRRATIVQLPEGELGGRQCEVPTLQEIRTTPFCRVKAPGSIGVMRDPGGGVSVLVCNNYIHRVTRHVLDPDDGYRVTRNQVFLRRGLKIPDGVAVSGDGEWIAISSHHTNDVKVFSTSARLGRLAKAVGIMKDANFPHGLRFTADGRYLLVADAGSQAVNVYARGDTWAGPHEPVRSALVLDDETFARGRVNLEEGGPKGIDIDRTGTVVAVTCDTQPLAFYSLADFIGELPLS